jgi:hypothetical protein
MTTKRTLTAYGVRTNLWEMLNLHSNTRTGRWVESYIVARMAEYGATKRQTVNALLAYLDAGDLVCSPGPNPTTGKFEPEYHIAAHCFGIAS